jgi:hypothetical protein
MMIPARSSSDARIRARAEVNQKSSVARRCRRRGKEAKIERANTNTANIIGGALRR